MFGAMGKAFGGAAGALGGALGAGKGTAGTAGTAGGAGDMLKNILMERAGQAVQAALMNRGGNTPQGNAYGVGAGMSMMQNGQQHASPEAAMQWMKDRVANSGPMRKPSAMLGASVGPNLPGQASPTAGSIIGSLFGRMGIMGPDAPRSPMKRFNNAQRMIGGYQNGWNPNPVLEGIRR